MIQRNNYTIDLHYEIPEDSCQPFIMFTTYFNLTEKQMTRTLEQLISELELKLGARITLLEVLIYETGQPVDLKLYRDFPKPVRSSDDLKRALKRHI